MIKSRRDIKHLRKGPSALSIFKFLKALNKRNGSVTYVHKFTKYTYSHTCRVKEQCIDFRLIEVVDTGDRREIVFKLTERGRSFCDSYKNIDRLLKENE